MSNKDSDFSLLHELILSSTKANESIKFSLTSISDSLESIAEVTEKTEEKIDYIYTKIKTFIDIMYKIVAPIILALLVIIGILLYQSDVKGGKVIKDVSKTMMNLPN